MQKSNLKGKINQLLKSAKELKVSDDLTNVMSDLKDILNEMGKAKFLGFGGNQEARNIAKQLQKCFKAGRFAPSTEETLKLANDIKKIRDLETVGDVIINLLEKKQSLGDSIKTFSDTLNELSKNLKKANHADARALGNALAKVSKDVGDACADYKAKKIYTELNNGDLNLEANVSLRIKHLSNVESKNIMLSHLNDCVNKLVEYGKRVEEIEQTIEGMVEIYNKKRQSLDVNMWKPITLQEKNTLYDQIEGLDKLTAKEIVTTLITASDGKYKSENEKHKKLMKDLGDDNGPLKTPLQSLKELIP